MNKHSIFKKLFSDIECGKCGKRCYPTNIDALGRQKDTWFFTVHCSSCNSRGLVIVNLEIIKELVAVPGLTEADKNHSSTPIDSSDTLDMQTFLKDFGGDFSSLFTEE